jgi:hypothetical protein
VVEADRSARLSKAGNDLNSCGIRGAHELIVRLRTGIDGRAQLDWRGSSMQEIGAHADTSKGESPIELHLLFVPDSELNGAPRQKRGAPGAAVTEKEKMGSQKDRQANGQSIFKRSARRNSAFGPFARSSFSQQFARTGLRTAWKYVFLFRAGHRLTRYLE